MLLNPNNSFKLEIEIEHSQASIVSVQLGFFFFFFPFCWQPVDVEQWRERDQMFLGLEINLECNK